MKSNQTSQTHRGRPNVLRKAFGTSIVLSSLVLPAGTGCGKSAEEAQHVESPDHDHDHAKLESEHADGGHDDHAHGEHADEVKLTPEAIAANGILIAKAAKQSLASTLNAPARLAFNAENVAHVGSILKGRVVDLKVRLGDAVKKGDTLAIIDSAELGEAQSEYLLRSVAAETAKPASALAKSAADRAQLLYDKNQGISLTELQKRSAEYGAAQGAASIAAASARAAESRLQLLGMSQEAINSLAESKQLTTKYAIVAPIDGQVIQREVTLGELVSPDDEQLLTLADLRTLWAFADIPEARLADIAAGAKATVTAGVLNSAAAAGVVAHVASQIDSATRTARLRIEIPNADLALRPGMFATARIEAGAATESVVVPDAAVQTVEGEPAVFVPHPGEANTFVKRPVRVGPAVNGAVPVLSGLKEGEQFVAAGSFILKAQIGKEGAAHEH